MDTRPIGIFDSGVGGLTVVKEVMKHMPGEDIIYFGDTARVPYGSKSKETVTKFSKQIVHFLKSKDVKAIIIACNTASSNSYDALVEHFDIPIIEVISPGVDACLKVTKNGIVGIIGTEATIRSDAYRKKLLQKNKDIIVHQKACPLFVPLAEEGFIDENNQIATLTARKYLNELVEQGIDALILGCTHYPLLNSCIKNAIGDKIEIVNPAIETAMKIKRFLTDNAMLNEATTKEREQSNHKFYVSDYSSKFEQICSVLLNENYMPEKIDIAND